MQPCNIAHQIVEAVAGHPARGVHIHALEALHDLGVVGDVKVRDHGLAEALHLYVGGVVGADGDRGVDDVGDDQHDFADLLGQLCFLLLQLGQTVRVGLHLGLGLLGLLELAGVLFGLSHQHTHLLAQGVPGGTELLGLRNHGAVLLVQLQYLVHQGELRVLEFLLYVFPDCVGVVSNEFDV